MTISKEAKVGILALVSAAILYLGFNFLKGSDVFSGMNEYHVTYQNVDGLVTSNAVMLNGLQVGKVKSIDIVPEKNNQLLVTLSVNRSIKVTEGSIASLADNGFLGGKNINLYLANNKKYLETGAELVSKTEQGISALIKEKTLPVMSNVDTLINQLKNIATKFDSTGLYLNKLLKTSDKSIAALNSSVGGTLAENRENLKGITSNMNALSASLIETEKGVKPLMGKMGSVVDSLNALKLGEAVASTKKSLATLQNIMDGIQQGKGTIGKLMKNDSVYLHLNRTMADLDRLFINLKEDPKRYVHFSLFGKKDKKAKADSLKK
jgi:phospholipid/cholesterol/gamma-HCH transport system substrate-binding protein